MVVHHLFKICLQFYRRGWSVAKCIRNRSHQVVRLLTDSKALIGYGEVLSLRINKLSMGQTGFRS